MRALPLLSESFGAAVLEPIRLHVAAKRYLAAVEPGYFEQLSEASKLSLKLQGGPMAGAQVQAFEAEPFFADAVRLRRWDDAAKRPAREVPPLDTYRAMAEALLR